MYIDGNRSVCGSVPTWLVFGRGSWLEGGYADNTSADNAGRRQPSRAESRKREDYKKLRLNMTARPIFWVRRTSRA
jgi:hypothetical protein